MPVLVGKRPGGGIRQRKEQCWMRAHWEDWATIHQGASRGGCLHTDEIDHRWMPPKRFEQVHTGCWLRGWWVLVERPAAIAPDAFLRQMLENHVARTGEFLWWEEVFSLDQAVGGKGFSLAWRKHVRMPC